MPKWRRCFPSSSEYRCQDEILGYLLAQKVDASLKESRGCSALDWARQKNIQEAVDILEKPGTGKSQDETEKAT